MTDPNEIAALKASFRGALAAADALASMKDRIEAVGDDIAAADLEEVARLATANSVAAAALRGLVNVMQARRSGG
jgi:hypothetical protein